MSQIVTRKGAVNDDKEKRTDSPVKDMKKKVAANAEKEASKQADKPQDKVTEKPADKTPDKVADKPADKKEKSLDKSFEKKSDKKESKSAEKPAEKKSEKAVEKKLEKPADKKAEQKDEVPKPKDDTKGEKSDNKPDKSEEKKTQSPKPKQNGQETHNGIHSNGNKENGTVSSDEDDQNDMLVIEEQDEMFPELAYDDGSDVECFEPPTPENVPSRSLTRRSQAKQTRTPETPRPASGKQDLAEDSKEPKDKVLKLKEDGHTSDRKLRSADSPKPQEKIVEEKEDGKSQETEKMDADVIIDVDAIEGGERRKTDTNFSKSRVKVSPYRRSLRLDNTTSSVTANYTGNNTTMEMDFTESSFNEDSTLDDSPYLSGLRQIRGRRSYKPLKEMQMRRLVHTSSVKLSEQGRPTVTVVGRKRKPELDAGAGPDGDAGVDVGVDALAAAPHASKRARLFDRIAMPFRKAEIVGVNTDLPLSTAFTPAETFDPETIKQSVPLAPIGKPVQERERKCIIM